MFSRFFAFIKRTYLKYTIFIGILLGFVIVYMSYLGIYHTSTDTFCGICHVHPQATYSWKKSTHYKNKSGMVVHCIECHLPSGGLHYIKEKARLGAQDVYGKIFKDTESIDWEAKSELEHAITYSYDSSCLKCHPDLYSLDLSPKGVQAHEYYMKFKDKIRCINCHITVGHYQPEREEEEFELDTGEEEYIQPSYPPDTGDFVNYTEIIPETNVKFNMISIQGGTFQMGSTENEPKRRENESPPQNVKLSPFWMGETEVTWREFLVFYDRTATRGKTVEDTKSLVDTTNVDAITGPTPPYGSPDQGWGKGMRPAITMTHHAAVTYCEWLFSVTGKKYRLPTEAEWEYACRAGTTGPYHFEGDPEKLTGKSWKNRLFGLDDTIINKYVWFGRNSSSKTQPPYSKEPNPWGLYNMLGNVREFCLDWYSPDIYQTYEADDLIINPRGPAEGKEHVIRGGSYSFDPADMRVAARDHTYHDRWLITDPQSPKSIWWYSDSKDVGLRVVREYKE